MAALGWQTGQPPPRADCVWVRAAADSYTNKVCVADSESESLGLGASDASPQVLVSRYGKEAAQRIRSTVNESACQRSAPVWICSNGAFKSVSAPVCLSRPAPHAQDGSASC